MLMRPDRGGLPRYVSYLTLLLVPVLGLGMVSMGDPAAAVAWRQEAPQTTGPGGVETTEPTTTESTTTEPTTTEPTTTESTSTTATCITAPTDTAATVACPSTTVGEPVESVIDALQEVTPGVVVESKAAAGTTVEDAASILATTGDAPTSVQVAREPGGNVAVAGAGAGMGVGLPAAQGIRPQRPIGNVAVFAAPDPTQADVAVQPRDTGARVMVIIRSPGEPQTYVFPVQKPPGGKLVPIAPDESSAQNTQEERNTTGYVILDRHGRGVGSIAAPWALDKEPKAVPTWFTLELGGDAIVQHIAHTGAQYPVVADPLLSVGCGWSGGCAVWFSRSVTRHLTLLALVGAIGFRELAGKVCAALLHPVARFVCATFVAVVDLVFFGKLQAALEDASADHSCLRVTFRLLRLTRFAADDSPACDKGAETGRQVQPVRVKPVKRGSQPFITNESATFTEVGGALFWIPNTEQLALLTGERDNPWRQVKRISARQLRRYRDLPANGTLFQEVSNSRAYYVAAGHCWHVTAEQFKRRFRSKTIWKVPDGGLHQCPYAGDLPTR
jgi:hypothetical protein